MYPGVSHAAGGALRQTTVVSSEAYHMPIAPSAVAKARASAGVRRPFASAWWSEHQSKKTASSPTIGKGCAPGLQLPHRAQLARERHKLLPQRVGIVRAQPAVADRHDAQWAADLGPPARQRRQPAAVLPTLEVKRLRATATRDAPGVSGGGSKASCQ